MICPSSPIDAKGLLAAALEGDDPVIFLEPKVLYRSGREEVPTSHYTIPIGKARVVREGTDVTVVTYGGMVPVAVKAAEQAVESVEVIDLRTLFPWDRQTVLGLGRERLAAWSWCRSRRVPPAWAPMSQPSSPNEPCTPLRAPIVRITGLDTPWPQFAIERHALITPTRVLAGIKKVTDG